MSRLCKSMGAGVLAVLLAGCNDGGGSREGASLTGCIPVAPQAATAAAPAALAADGRPLTIPALREWRASAERFQLCEQSRIVAAEPALAPVARVFAEDFREQTGRRISIVRAGTAHAGDIVLGLGESDSRLGAEGYRLTVAPVLRIKALEPAGVFYGTRTLLQLFRQAPVVAGGEALDWPRYPERGLMVDIGRKHFSYGWLERHIREMAYLKLNLFHLHFSESLGFRIESEAHPEIVSGQHLTKDEVRRLVELAGRYFITVVPELGMPSHMGAALAPHPEFQLKDAFGQPSANNLDVGNPAAVAFARELLEEFLPLFPGPYWHTGADEYLAFYDYLRYPQLQAHAQAQYGAGANGKDAVHGFTNAVAEIVRAGGKTARMWHDDLNGGSAVTVNPGIIVEWWTNFSPIGDLVLIPSPQELLDRGHSILNAGWFPTYYVVGAPAGFPEGLPPRVDVGAAYEEWEAHHFYGPLDTGPIRTPPATVAADEPRNRGSKLHVWCDQPDAETEDEIALGIAPRLRVITQKTWNSPRLTESYAEFEQIMDGVGHAPGFEAP